MTLDESIKAVQHIRDIAGDDERAHHEQDELYLAFIKHVAECGPEELRLMAAEILKVRAIEFCRWCA